MNIKKIQKVSKNKYKIYFDNIELITYDNVIVENNLLYKKEIDEVLYDKLVKDTAFFEIYNKVFKFASNKMRSKKEILEFISKYNLDKSTTTKIISKLEELKLINDLEYVKAFINDNIYLSKNGINKIRVELLNQNIPIDMIDNELSKIDDEVIINKIEKIVSKKTKINHKYSNQFLKQKLLHEMIMLGYPKDIVNKVIDKYITSDDNILKNEFYKINNKLKYKYEGEQLKNILRQKLLIKGFNIDDINNLIEKGEN